MVHSEVKDIHGSLLRATKEKPLGTGASRVRLENTNRAHLIGYYVIKI